MEVSPSRGRRQKDAQRHRMLTLSIVRVEVRVYRRSRTSSDVIRKPAHFQYILRCQWSDSQESSPVGYWWDELPSSYEIRRRWEDVVRLHTALRLIAEKIPDLPHRGSVDDFLIASEDELSDLTYVYVENRLAPYFADISVVLRDIPPASLSESKAFRFVVTSGPSSLQRAMPFARLSTPELQAAARSLKQSQSWQDSQSMTIHRKEERAEDRRSPIVQVINADEPQVRTPEDSLSLLATTKGPQRWGASHYHFFAKALPPQALGSPSGRDLCFQMELKERRELAYRTFLEPLPCVNKHRPGSQRSLQRQRAHASSPALVGVGKAAAASEGLASMLAGHGRVKTSRLEMTLKEICAGLRTLILNEEAPEVLRGKRKLAADIVLDERNEGSHIETLTVYRIYRKLLDEDCSDAKLISAGLKDSTEGSSTEEEDDLTEEEKREQRHERERLAYIKDLGVPRELLPISWTAIFVWVEREGDFADDSKKKSCCMSTLRALKDWRQFEASVAQSHLGVSLNMLFQWIWPCAAPSNIATMLSWIAQFEFEKIRQPTPELMSSAARIQVETAFKVLDVKGRGYINAEDLAGRPGQTPAEASRNIIDVDTVREVYGRHPMGLSKFLEIMSPDGFRGHEDATQVMLGDGCGLVLSNRELVGCSGWIYRDAPQTEEHQRRIIDAIEAEVKRWKNLERLRISTLSAREAHHETETSGGPNPPLESSASVQA